MNRKNNQSGEPIAAAIRGIASDNASGAAEILRRAGAALELLNARSSGLEAIDVEAAQRAVLAACTALALAQPDMSPLVLLASKALGAARIETDARQALQAAQDAALNFIETAERAAHSAAMEAAALICEGGTVLTHSRSSTVLAALVEAKARRRAFSVVATESRPMLEGRTLAAALAAQCVSVALIADAAASLAMDHVDMVLIGADKVTPMSLVNKIGTRMIALAARERGLPVFSICDSSKFIRENYFSRAARDSNDPAELWPDAPRGVDVVNRYFEPTPLDCFTGIITEDGVLSCKEAGRRAEQASIDQELVKALRAFRDRIK